MSSVIKNTDSASVNEGNGKGGETGVQSYPWESEQYRVEASLGEIFMDRYRWQEQYRALYNPASPQDIETLLQDLRNAEGQSDFHVVNVELLLAALEYQPGAERRPEILNCLAAFLNSTGVPLEAPGAMEVLHESRQALIEFGQETDRTEDRALIERCVSRLALAR